MIRSHALTSILVITVVWLSIGAGMSVAIAWTIVLCVGAESVQAESAPLDKPTVWPHNVPPEWPEAATVGFFQHWFLYDFHMFALAKRTAHPADMTKLPRVFVMYDVRVGVPMRCVSEWTSSETLLGAPLKPGLLHGNWSVKPPFLKRAELPLVPIWIGLAVNSGIYGGLAYGLYRIPGVFRRWNRRRTNQCIHCGYSLGGLSIGIACPECGKR